MCKIADILYEVINLSAKAQFSTIAKVILYTSSDNT
jgi:hypothetical protein